MESLRAKLESLDASQEAVVSISSSALRLPSEVTKAFAQVST